MLPADLKAEQFSAYPPQARKLAVANIEAFRRLPLVFLPNLLREAIEYDFKFPVERKALEREIDNLASLSPDRLAEWFGDFSKIQLSPELEKMDWVDSPAQFVEQLSAHLWATHQLDAFRRAAMAYGERLQNAIPPEPPAAPRLGIAVVGKGVDSYSEPLFRKLRPHGAYFTQVKPEGGLDQVLAVVAARHKAHPIPYSHWYVDGGAEAAHDDSLTCVSYGSLAPARAALAEKMKKEIERPGMGPEYLRTMMARLAPPDLGMDDKSDPVLSHFQLKVLTEGSGTQIFSTTFAQWTAREALRRAQPLTLLVRFAPRQRQKPMNEMIARGPDHADLDPVGSLVDGDMGAYYNWLNQQRLTGADQSSFLVWFENHSEAVAIGPAMPRGTQSKSPAALGEVLSWLLG